MSWTDDRIALLKKMWKEGKSAAEIAKTLAKGVTRNAVIGKAHRMGLSGRPSPIKKPTVAPKKEVAVAAPKKLQAAAPVAPAAHKLGKKLHPAPGKGSPLLREPEEVKVFAREEIPPGGGVSLLDLTERMCKWPIGDPREDDFVFCGRGIRVGTPYCPDHAAAAYQSSSRRSAQQHYTTAPAAVAVVAPVANEDKEVEVEADAEVADDDADDEEVTA